MCLIYPIVFYLDFYLDIPNMTIIVSNDRIGAFSMYPVKFSHLTLHNFNTYFSFRLSLSSQWSHFLLKPEVQLFVDQSNHFLIPLSLHHLSHQVYMCPLTQDMNNHKLAD